MPPTTGVKVKLDRQRTLRFTNRALVALEEETGQTLSELGKRLQEGSVSAVNKLVWAGLIHAEPGLSPDDVLDRVDLRRLEAIGEAVGRAIEAALGTEDEDADAGKGKAGADD